MEPSNLLHRTCYLITKHWGCFQIWPSLLKNVSVTFRFCFNEHLKCSVEIITKKFPVFLESSNLKFVKKFSSSPESIPVKNLNKILLPTNLIKPVASTVLLIINKLLFRKSHECISK